ncbi:ABC transporter substrate-binding protein [Paenibacillus hamazuiensis]|uniref:ABC transporter substrate-binding protein n=1 Tax=Paenibacillus hamazuiensis TaxID=2936508 RepID=UPI00200EC657|nr:sugar ABC transporter substrate-binding protein [Paenibacillus hamazuiensis]
MKKVTLAILSVVTATSVTACESKPQASESGNQSSSSTPAKTVTINIATVNNPDMKVMEELKGEFESTHPGIKVNFTAMPDDDLRKKVTLNVSTKSGEYDIATIGPYEVSTWAKNDWLEPLNPLFEANADIQKSYDVNDIIKPINGALSLKDKMYALPFYGESNMIFYRKDLFEQKGLTMPEQPTWDDIYKLAKQLNDPANGMYGIALNGTPQYGQLAPLLTVINTFGAKWFDMDWNPQINSPEFKKAVSFYVNLLKEAGEPGATNVGFNEGLGLISQGKAAMWYHATVAAGMLNDPNTSKVVGKIGYAKAPVEVTPNGSHWLYTWGLGILSSSTHKKEAFEFITWATSKDYIKLVANKKGWALAPSGTRYSTYENQDYLKAAPWSKITKELIDSADINKPAKDQVPYTGLAQIHLPEYAAFASEFGQNFAAVVTGALSVDEALQKSQEKTTEIMKKAGYIKK